MHLSSDNTKFRTYSDASDSTENIFNSLRSKYQHGLEKSMKGSDFIFDSIQLIYYKCHNVNFKREGWYIDSPVRMKKKKTAINQKDHNDKGFHYAATVASNYEKIKWNPERISNIKPFINKYNWEKINYSSKIDDWKKFEKNSSNFL